MEKVFLFDPKCLSYRIHIYQYFREEFQNDGYDLHIYYESERKPIEEEGFHPVNYGFKSFRRLIKKEKPAASIYFIWLRYKFSLPFQIYNKLFMQSKVIVWSKGKNIKSKRGSILNIFYFLRQLFTDSMILYSKNEIQHTWVNKKQAFIAPNTINQHCYSVNDKAIENVRKKILFVGRIEKRKHLDILIEAMIKAPHYDLQIIGPGMPDEMQNQIKSITNISYVGPVYEMSTLSDYFSKSDCFCIPGAIGLGVNEAFLFGIPVVTARIGNDPELISSEPIMLLEEGKNCELFQKNSREGLIKALSNVLDDETHLKTLKSNARKTFEEKAKIEYMRDGFINAINYAIK